jgi:Ca2+-binding EF-hand superfamily protein
MNQSKITPLGKKSSTKSMSFSKDIEFMNYELEPIVKIAMIKMAFKMFDEDGSQEIDKKEFKKLVTSLGIELDDKKIMNLFREIDTNRSNTIDIAEFTEMMIKYQLGKDSPIEIHLEHAFGHYDKDGDGFIGAKDFLLVCEELEDTYENQMSEDEIETLISIIKSISESNPNVKIRGEGTFISKEEFINGLIELNFLKEVKKEDQETNLFKSSSKIGENDSSNLTNSKNGKNANLSSRNSPMKYSQRIELSQSRSSRISKDKSKSYFDNN